MSARTPESRQLTAAPDRVSGSIIQNRAHPSITNTMETAGPRSMRASVPLARKRGSNGTTAITNASVTPTPVAPGQAIAINADFRYGQTATVATYYEIRNEADAIVHHTSYNWQIFSAGVTKTYTWNVTLPSDWPAGTYRVHAGIFAADWSSTLHWVSSATTFVVQASAPEPPPPPPPTTGRQFYVDSASGSDSSDGTSPSTAWRSLNKVNGTTFAPGDGIYFKRGGVWQGTLQVRSSGTSAEPIRYGAYDAGAAPQIKNPGVNYGTAVTVTGSHNVIQDFLLTDAHYAGIAINAGAAGNVVRKNEITRTGLGVMVSGEYNLMTANYVHDLTMIVNDSQAWTDYGAVCFWVQANNNEISYNTGINCKAPSIDFGVDGGFIEVWQTGDNTYVHHNWAENNTGFFELGASANGSAQNITVAYNTIVNPTGGLCLCFNTGSYHINVGTFRFEHNTYVSKAGDPSGYRVFGCRDDLTALHVRNNIFYSDLQIANNGNFTRANNLYYMVNMVNGSGIGFSLGSGEQMGDPGFVNVGGHDFRLQSWSRAVDTGLHLGHASDFMGVPLPQGRAPDLGAFEFH